MVRLFSSQIALFVMLVFGSLQMLLISRSRRLRLNQSKCEQQSAAFTSGLPLASEAAEVLALQRELGWRNVQGMPGYTEHRQYSYLYIYLF